MTIKDLRTKYFQWLFPKILRIEGLLGLQPSLIDKLIFELLSLFDFCGGSMGVFFVVGLC